MVSYSTNTPIGQGEDVPLFQQVAQRIADDIVDSTLAEGDQVPSINEFSTFWRINPATALKGVAQLVADGILYKQRGIGTFVADGARARLLEQRRADFHRRFVGPLLTEAARLGLTPAQVIELISQEEA
jgi:DNA-binding transcriptional regulator YhcF (GntR family)